VAIFYLRMGASHPGLIVLGKIKAGVEAQCAGRHPRDYRAAARGELKMNARF
jgi:hypothetical protein